MQSDLGRNVSHYLIKLLLRDDTIVVEVGAVHHVLNLRLLQLQI
jgi:hypothetical protein